MRLWDGYFTARSQLWGRNFPNGFDVNAKCLDACDVAWSGDDGVSQLPRTAGGFGYNCGRNLQISNIYAPTQKCTCNSYSYPLGLEAPNKFVRLSTAVWGASAFTDASLDYHCVPCTAC